MDYELGLEQLKQRLHNTAWEQEFLIYDLRLRDNIQRERLYGTNEQIRSDRAQIVDQLNRLAQHVKVNFNALCQSFRNPAEQEKSNNTRLHRCLQDIEKAIVDGHYYSAYRAVVGLSKQAAEEIPVQEAARIKYLEALIHLNGKHPCKHAPSVMKQAEAALQDACRLHNLAAYKRILALVKQDFARTGVQVKKYRDEAAKLAKQARRLPVRHEDREVIALFARCYPRLSQEYNHLLAY